MRLWRILPSISSHSTQVRWELYELEEPIRVKLLFTLHTGQMGTLDKCPLKMSKAEFTLHSGQMGTGIDLRPYLSYHSFTLHTGQMGTSGL